MVGGKGVNLAILLQEGLPVPPGYCITTEAHDYFNNFGNLPDGLLSSVKQLKELLGGKVAIRSSANCEDGKQLSMAGVFESHYVNSDSDIEPAMIGIYRQARSRQVEDYLRMQGLDSNDVKMGIVVQKLIEPDLAGVIYDEKDSIAILLQYLEGFGARLVDGQAHGSAVYIDKAKRQIQESVGFETRPLSQHLINQIVDYSRQISRIFAGESQDIEIATQGDKVYILQARPLTTNLGEVKLEETVEETLEITKLKLRDLAEKEKHELGTDMAVFSDTNFSELLPKPTEMDFGIFSYIFTGSDGIPGAIQLGRREMGYPLGDESVGLMNYIGGRPYLSIARDAATFYAGFPDKPEDYFSILVNEYLKAVNDDPKKGSYPEMGLYLQDPTPSDLEARFGQDAEKYYQTYLKFLEGMRKEAISFKDQFTTTELPEIKDYIENMQNIDLNSLDMDHLVVYGNTLLEHLRTVSCVDFVKAARLGFYYSQRMQAQLKLYLNLNDEESEVVFAKLSQGLDGSAITDVNIAIATARTESEALELGYQYVGHYSTGEMLEVRHTRFKDSPKDLNTYVVGIRQSEKYLEDFEKQKKERLKVQNNLLIQLPEASRDELRDTIVSAQTYMALRETVKYHFAREYSLFRDYLETIARRLDLPENVIYFAYPREISRLVYDPSSMIHILESRKKVFDNYAQLEMPSVIRESDINNLDLSMDKNGEFTELKGKFLAEGPAFIGVIVNLDDFTELEQAKEMIESHQAKGEQIILVASQLNLSHDPYIALASGLIIENAGIVSHGAQRARELGRGAIGSIKSRYLKTGMKINFDPQSRTIYKEKDEEDQVH